MFNLPNELIYTGCFKKVLNGLRRLTTILIQTTFVMGPTLKSQ